MFKIKIKNILGALFLALTLAASPSATLAQTSNNSLWYVNVNKLQPIINSYGLKIPSLSSTGLPCVTVSTTGIFATSTCGGGGTSYWTYDSSLDTLYPASSTTKVGIGTSSPSQTLDVWGNVNVATGTTPAFVVDTTRSRVSINSSSTPSHSLNIGMLGNGLAVYNTVDQTTNYERAALSKSSNIYTLYSENGGTGTQREMRVGGSVDYFSFVPVASLGSPKFTMTRAASSTASLLNITTTGGGFSGSSNNQYALQLSPAVGQSGTASLSVLKIAPNIVGLGSGPNYLMQVGTAASPTLFAINTTGSAIFNSDAGTAGQILQSNGSSASPTWVATSSLNIDHDDLIGLADDDHTQYALLAGRSGGQALSGGTAANDDISIQGTTNGTRATSYVTLQPNGGFVGIGSGAPTTELSVNGNMNLVVSGGVNRTISFGVGLGVPALLLYNGGTNLDWGWGLEGGRNVSYGVAGGSNSFVWRNGGALTGGTNLMTLTLSAGDLVTAGTIRGTKLGAGMVPVSFIDVLGTAANGTVGTESTIRTARSTTGGLTFGQAFEIMVGRWKTPTSFSPDTRVDFKLKHASDSTLSGDTTVMTLQSNGAVGIGTTSVAASRLSLHQSGGALSTPIFTIASSTSAGAATTTLFAFDGNGNMKFGGPTVTLSSCGGTPSVGTGSNQTTGTITTGTSSPTTCIVTFASTLQGTPTVFVNTASTTVRGVVTSKSTSSFTVTFDTAYTSGVFDYWVVTR